MLTTTVVSTVVSASTSVHAAPPGDPQSGAQALLLYLLAQLAALWANAPNKPLRQLVERTLRALRPLLIDPPSRAPIASLVSLAESTTLIERIHLTLCWEARGLRGWQALNASLELLLATLRAEQSGRAA